MARILVVDDEAGIRDVIKEYAEFEGHEVEEAADGMAAIELVKEKDFDIVILDIMMPRLDGFSTCKEMRKIKDIPVIMLSARGEEYDKLFGFELGIDDYIVKPFSPKELMARINVVLSRNRAANAASQDKLVYEGLEIDFAGRSVIVDGEHAKLTPKEFLARNKNIAFSRQQLLSKVWGYDFFGDDRTVDTYVKMLRANLGPYRKCIVTLRGMGYKFEI